MKTLIRRWRKGRKSSGAAASESQLDRRQALQQQLPDASAEDCDLIATVEKLTMTSPERILALINAVRHLTKQKIAGDFVECGVWKGGSMVATANTLIAADDLSRQLWLYDTFEGMSVPTGNDVDFMGQQADVLLAEQDREQSDSIWCFSPQQQVHEAMLATGYPEENIRFVAGKVEDTLPTALPQKIALLRLDTDWYESTKCELEHLFPRMVDGGALIIDDYGHWEGCQRAVDEYFEKNNINIMLCRIDYTGRIGIVNHR